MRVVCLRPPGIANGFAGRLLNRGPAEAGARLRRPSVLTPVLAASQSLKKRAQIRTDVLIVWEGGGCVKGCDSEEDSCWNSRRGRSYFGHLVLPHPRSSNSITRPRRAGETDREVVLNIVGFRVAVAGFGNRRSTSRASRAYWRFKGSVRRRFHPGDLCH